MLYSLSATISFCFLEVVAVLLHTEVKLVASALGLEGRWKYTRQLGMGMGTAEQ